MHKKVYSSHERVKIALEHKEPDKATLILPLSVLSRRRSLPRTATGSAMNLWNRFDHMDKN